METKLKSIFLNPQLRLASKAFGFLGLLVLARSLAFSPLAVLLFILGVVFLYTQPLFRTVERIGDLAVLIFSVLIFNSIFSDSLDFLISSLHFSLLFFILIGIKDLVFIRRVFWSIVLNLGLIYPLLLVFFQGSFSVSWWKLILFFLIFLVLTKNVFGKRALAAPLSLLALEVAWASSFLPIGFIATANLNFLFYASLIAIFDARADDLLDKKRVFFIFSIFAILFLVIFALSNWSF